MATGDGLLVRLPLAEALSPKAAAALAGAAASFGNGTIEISARGSLQLRGLREETLPPLRAALAEARIVARASAVETDLAAAHDPCAVDPRPLAALVSQRIATIAGLGAKISVVVDGGGRWTLASLAADVRLEACAGGWRVGVGGDGATARTLGVFAGAGAAADAATALLAAIAAAGPAVRGRDLCDEVVSAIGDAAALAERRDPGALAAAPRPAGRQRAAPAGARAKIGVGALGTGAVLVVAPPFGAFDAKALGRLADAAAAAAAACLAPGIGRTLAIVLPSRHAATRLAAIAAALGFIVDPADRRLAVIACAGSPACASGFVATRPLAARIAAALPAGTGTVHVSGCAKRCARPAHAVAELVGGPEGLATWGDPALAALLARIAAAPQAAR